ncbi:MAG TPA: hypothetical protein VFS34_03900 [Thermoanaerobaculia bacterium]|nr:hypothetical protein [Thermoanaerobaculia bacterium]
MRELRFFVAALVLVAAQRAAAAPPLSADGWREDLKTLAERLPRIHADAFHAVPREEWEREIAELDRSIPTMTPDAIAVGFMRLVARIGDGHTSMNPFFAGDAKAGFHTVGARLYAFSDGIYVRAAAPDHREIVGAKVVGVGGVPVDEAFRRVAEVVSHDNEEGLRLVVPMYFGVPEILAGLGLGDGRTAKWELEKDGRRFSAELPGASSPAHGHGGGSVFVDPPGWIDASSASGKATPLWLKNPGDLYWMEYLGGPRVLYVQYNGVADRPDESIAAFFARVFRFAGEHPVDRFVLDIRLNSGGNNFLNAPVVAGILRAHLDERGKLFVVIGRSTFSAAQNLVNDLSRFARPTFVGEPTGSRPSQYGDHEAIVLPRSGLTVMASTMYWPDRTKPDPRLWTAPRLPAPLSFADYRSGVDPAMESIIRYRSIAEAVRPALDAGDAAALEKSWRAFAADPASAGAPIENETNDLGYDELREGHSALALTLFRLNAERHPKSPNAQDSLGEGYLAAGDLVRARECYRNVLALEPGDANAQRMLRVIDERAGEARR